MKQKIHNRPPRAIVLLLGLIYSISTFTVFAQGFEYDGIYYGIISFGDRTVCVDGYQSVSGDIVIPKKVCDGDGHWFKVVGIRDNAFDYCTGLTSITMPETVTSIGKYAFKGCTGLTSITMPNSVISIGEGAFYGCTGLTSIEIPSSVTSIGRLAFSGCTGLTSIEIPSSVTSIGRLAFSDCTSLQSINVESDNPNYSSLDGVLFNKEQTLIIKFPHGKSGSYSIPSSVTSIGNSSFSGCTGLTSISLPNTLTSIGDLAFYYCTGLTSISLPNSLTSIGNSSFSSCTGLTSITIPNSVTSIDSFAFYDCESLQSINVESDNPNYSSLDGVLFNKDQTSIITLPAGKSGSYTIPSSVTSIGGWAFAGCTLNPLLILSKDCDYDSYTFEGLSNESTIVAYESDAIKNAIKYSRFEGICVFDTDGPYYESDINTTLLSASFKINKSPLFESGQYEYDLEIENGTPNQTITGPDEKGYYKVTGLVPNTSYTVNINYHCVDNPDDKGVNPVLLKTNDVAFNRSVESTQTTVTITNLSVNCTEDEKPDRLGVLYNGKEYDYSDKPIRLSNLDPGEKVYYDYYAYYGESKYSQSGSWIKTKSLNPRISAVAGPTSIQLSGEYDEGDAEIAKMWFAGQEEGANVTITGLTPGTKASYTFYIETDQGYQVSVSKDVTTSPLELKILQPKCVSQNCAIVAAETNIEDEEPNVGFEWKKYDAPETLPAKEGYGAVYNGMLEGYIKNLQSTSYYNVRAFYKDSAGKYYYSDWITFDPSDFSFFEPTVHTYPIENVKEHSATVRGYVLAGTDNIKRQGVQYWPEKSGSQIRFNAPAASDIVTVEATGQSMTIELDNLRAGTTYVCRAFVETVAGYTYGEEQKFTTPQTTGVEDVIVGTSEAEPTTIVGYYDLTGKRYDEPRHGFNIVLYSDGTTRKIYVNADR